MAEFKPTKSQSDAIFTRGREILVSAAAGSGKTKVLTERLLSRISDDSDIDSFLVITFTKAAAAELRSRIVDEIALRLASEPDNRRLRRQSALCQRAQICTIHSFCQSFLRENCHAAGISPEFRVIEEDRSETIKAGVLQRVLDECYEDPDEGFLSLTDAISRGQDDKRLAELTLSLHRKMQSHARPEEWAARQLEVLEQAYDDAGKTPWGEEILQSVKASADYWAERMELLAKETKAEEKIAEKYAPSIEETASSLRDLSRAAAIGWDKARSALPIKFPNLGRLTKSPNPELSEYIKAVRDACKAQVKKYDEQLADTSDELLRDMRSTAPASAALLELALRFDREYAAQKRRRAEVDFSDLEHMTVQLLTNPDGSPTELARETSRRYTEIMVDEYQDVNRVQDAIFTALSGERKNLFMVGDVKQSIYRFRLADPTIFTEKYLSYADLDSAAEGAPVRIMLQENFRSRREIIDGVNAVFRCCMSEKLGELNYDERAELKYGAGYEGEGETPELMLVDTASDGDDAPDKTEAEAAAVAKKIKQLMASGMLVSGRPLRYGDIAILMRSVSSAGETYRRALSDAQIPVMSGQGGSFFEAPEISTLMCLLAAIDNPHQDVPLIAVLRSAAFGFSADELSAIRVTDKNCDFYTALVKTAESSDKCAEFLKTLNNFRDCAPDMETGELLRHIYSELDLMALCAAMQGGQSRCSNLRAMLELAKRFESSGFRGLHRFNEWLNKLAGRGEDLSRGDGGDAVQIMTLHKSKGLEFPVVFVCDTSRLFNKKDSQSPVTVHPVLGLGPKVVDTARGVEYPSLSRSAIKLRSERELLSEEMRLLYVALTRARERLIVSAAVKDPEAKLKKLMLLSSNPMPPEMLMSAGSMSEWMMYALLCDRENKLKLSIVHAESEAESENDISVQPTFEADPELLARLEKNLSFVYPYAGADLPSKVTATELKGAQENDEEAMSLAPRARRSFRSPDFLKDKKPLSGTEKGTATHMLLQFMDYAKARTEQGIRDELARLTASGHLSRRQAEAVETGAVLRLFNSELGRRIMSADNIKREFRFSLLCPAESFFEGGEGENVLLQGVVDCIIEEAGELTIIDYKTDRVSGEEVGQRAKGYAGQLRAYALAVGRITGKPIKECVLYFLSCGKAVFVNEK